MFVVVIVLTAVFLGLFWLANHFVFNQLSQITPPQDVHVDTRTFAGAFLFGLALFATLFLGVVLAVFLTLGVVSGDAERGLLQPLVVRPLGRSTLLVARWLGAVAVTPPYVLAVHFTSMLITGEIGHWWPDRIATPGLELTGGVAILAAPGICVAYVLTVYFAAMAITGLTGHWWPDRIVWPGVELAGAVLIVIAISLLGSVVLSSTANGIAVFMLFGAGLVAGLLATIGHALNSHAVKHASTIAAWALPFEALYQDALRMITAKASGLTGFLLQLGPFGGAYVHGWPIRIWAAGYLVAILAIAVAAFSRRNL